ncbi:MAG: hypothetical protein QOK35_2415 [Pseudonocardiales bacterium]|nr:hypothetical protein [Pseudonocardiales bacterium]
MADGLAWGALGLLLVLLGIRAWVVESGHATLGRTPVRVKVLTGACALATVLVAGTVTVDGGARLVWLVLHPAEAQALEDAEKAAAEAERAAAEAAENGVTDPTAGPPAPGPGPAVGRPAPPAAPGPGAPGAGP